MLESVYCIHKSSKRTEEQYSNSDDNFCLDYLYDEFRSYLLIVDNNDSFVKVAVHD
jgi:hypothetical protein